MGAIAFLVRGQWTEDKWAVAACDEILWDLEWQAQAAAVAAKPKLRLLRLSEIPSKMEPPRLPEIMAKIWTYALQIPGH